VLQLLYADELASLVTGLNQYKKGGGNDRQMLLSLYSSARVPLGTMTDRQKMLEQKSYVLALVRALRFSGQRMGGVGPRCCVPATCLP
jgi:hypothetical protein